MHTYRLKILRTKVNLLIGISLLFLLVVNCKKKSETDAAAPLAIERLDKKLMAATSVVELQSILQKEPQATTLLFGGDAQDPALVTDIFRITSHAQAQKLFRQTEETFGDVSKLGKDFAIAFGEIEKLYPNFKPPRVVAGFSGLRNDLVVTDSLVVISLEAFVGSKAMYRPNYPDYMLSRFTPDHIVPNVIRLISNRYNQTADDADNFTAEMVFYGKSLEFCRAVLPHIADSLIIGYSNREMQNAYEHQDIIWAHIIDKQLLTSTNPAVNAKYFEERPYIGEIGPDCPGRIGQWLGWRVVELYRQKKPTITLPQLMENTSAQDILMGSKYRGQKDEK